MKAIASYDTRDAFAGGRMKTESVLVSLMWVCLILSTNVLPIATPDALWACQHD